MISDLVERAQRGDHDAFDALGTAAYHRLYAIARRILRDGYAAEDAVQETLVGAWRNIRSLREPERFDAWLHRLLVRACGDEVRRSRRRPIVLPALMFDRPSPTDDIATLVDQDEIERAFLALSVEHRAVLVLTLAVRESRGPTEVSPPCDFARSISDLIHGCRLAPDLGHCLRISRS